MNADLILVLNFQPKARTKNMLSLKDIMCAWFQSFNSIWLIQHNFMRYKYKLSQRYFNHLLSLYSQDKKKLMLLRLEFAE